MKKKKILILCGGISSESNISLISGQEVHKTLLKLGYHTETLDPSVPEFVKTLLVINPDIVFNALHGGAGENGAIASLLDLLQIPYTHSGHIASTIGMNKNITKHICQQKGIKCADSMLLTNYDYKKLSKLELFQNITQNGYFLKPNYGGSSVGIKFIKAGEKFDISTYDFSKWKEVLCEQYIDGREIDVSIFNDEVIGITEIKCGSEFFDYNAKYNSYASLEYIIDPDIPKSIIRKAQTDSLTLHNDLGCNTISRVEFIYGKPYNATASEKDDLYLLEINTHPGLTPNSILPKTLEKNNISYEEMLEFLLKRANYFSYV